MKIEGEGKRMTIYVGTPTPGAAAIWPSRSWNNAASWAWRAPQYRGASWALASTLSFTKPTYWVFPMTCRKRSR